MTTTTCKEMTSESWTREREYRLSELEKQDAMGELADDDKDEFDKLSHIREDFLQRGLQALEEGTPAVDDSRSQTARRSIFCMSVCLLVSVAIAFVFLILLDPNSNTSSDSIDSPAEKRRRHT
eukprot:TRINITY_DN35531_c0_g1_i1.p1 TRINITY_DN35531_c0_g1~~TRINITY_DN35531_c0_g1_i1.p1  ORF type:complete len:123 (+),score=28.70 TRINITY_DN35531_c0_g1_i1:59-427(+)